LRLRTGYFTSHQKIRRVILIEVEVKNTIFTVFTFGWFYLIFVSSITTKANIMKDSELKAIIEKLAIEMNLDFIAASQALQGQAAKLNQDVLLEQIQKVKMDYHFSSENAD
jgi:hypothetical protein